MSNNMQLDGSTPLWFAARTLLSRRGEDFFRLRDRTLKTSDVEDIHDLRVASRRLREGMDLFSPCYPAGNIARLVRQFKRVTRLLGDIRNTDEAIIFFSALVEELGPDHGSGLEGIIDGFLMKRKRELKGLRSGLREIASDPLHDLCRRIFNAPSLFTPAAGGIDLFMPLSCFAGDALETRLAVILKLLPEARQAAEIEAQHLLRIAIKHYRYRMEILSFLIGPCYEEIHGILKSYQDLLGKMHDLDVFAGIIRGTAFAPPTDDPVSRAITTRRDGLFADFTAMLEKIPFEKIGEGIRSTFETEQARSN
ncbi:MAG TPA: CHAD domain-containing protein [Geobacteraceae bacterium]|nr:CHAD domain-containing protein [Geobacteraceae bacterium]